MLLRRRRVFGVSQTRAVMSLGVLICWENTAMSRLVNGYSRAVRCRARDAPRAPLGLRHDRSGPFYLLKDCACTRETRTCAR